MPRKPRIHYPGAFYHCLNRGNQTKALFHSDDDYRFMLDCLANSVAKFDALIHAYCLMPNHFHLIIQVQEIPLSTILRSTLTGFARYFNKVHHQTGHVFQGRYRAILCQRESYLLELVRYIHLNPVRARLAETPQQWRWTSLGDYLHPGQHPWLHTQEVLSRFGKRPWHNLLAFLTQAPALAASCLYPPESFPILGDKAFVKSVTETVDLRRQLPRSIPGPRLTLQAIADACGEAFQIPTRLLAQPHKGSHTLCRLREVIIFAATQYFFYKPSQLAHFLRITPSSVTRLQQSFHDEIALNPNPELQILQAIIPK